MPRRLSASGILLSTLVFFFVSLIWRSFRLSFHSPLLTATNVVIPSISDFVRYDEFVVKSALADGIGEESATTKRNKVFSSDKKERCALNFYGLPRAFQALVLPSIIQHILIPNADWQCDIFVYYHALQKEDPGRSGRGGKVRPDDVLLLRDAAKEVAHGSYEPVVRFGNFTDEDFLEARGQFLNQTRMQVDNSTGKLLYMPVRSKDYSNETTVNVIRMWHAQHSVWELMQATAAELNVTYTRVGMFRAAVVFVTPIDIWRNQTTLDHENRIAVIPGFSRYPVNDRMIYGPARAVELWAAGRFDLIHHHVRSRPGWGVHSEYFLSKAILPAVRNLTNASYDIEEDPALCFLRARVDETIWLSDCTNSKGKMARYAKVVREMFAPMNRNCTWGRLKGSGVFKTHVHQLDCSKKKKKVELSERQKKLFESE